MSAQAFDYNLLAGGAAGLGMQTLGSLLAKAFLQIGYTVSTWQSYLSRIRGGHNYFQVRFSSAPIHSMTKPVDILIALDQNTITAHLHELSPQSIILYNSETIQPPETQAQLLGMKIYELFPEAKTMEVYTNTVYMGAIAGLLGCPPEGMRKPLDQALERKGPEVLAKNLTAFNAGLEFVRSSAQWNKKFPAPAPEKPAVSLGLSGNEALTLGIIASGCKFYTAYPMTPSSSILEDLGQAADKIGMVVEQAEDEVAALNMVLGATYAGVRAATGTSGGGFSLMVEALSLSGITECPAVVVLGQRPGPATGLPTRTEQGELAFAIHAGHGEFPRVVFAPGNLAQCFQVAPQAFNLADRFQIPAIILTDQYLADLYQNVAPFAPEKVSIDRGKVVTGTPDYKRYQLTEDGISPRAFPGKCPGVVIVDSDEHTEDGHLTEDLAVRKQMVEKRMRKNQGLIAESLAPEIVGEDKDNLVICWGSNYGVCVDAVNYFKGQGKRVSMMHFQQVWPLDGEKLGAQLRGYKNLISVENNATSQFARLLRGETSVQIQKNITKYDGLPFYFEDLVQGLGALLI